MKKMIQVTNNKKSPFFIGEKLRGLKCIDVTDLGYGVLKYNNFTIFTRNVIKDEVVDITITKVDKKHAIGKLDKKVKSSKYRVKSLCPYYLECNGCKYQGVDYKHQIEIKEKQLKSLFGYDVNVIEAEAEFNYRNKSEFFYDDNSFNKFDENNKLVKIDNCLIADNKINKLLPIVLEALNNNKKASISSVIFRVSNFNNEIMLILVSNSQNKYQQKVVNEIVGYSSEVESIILNVGESSNYLFNDKEVLMYGKDYLIDTILNKQFKISSKSFYQINNKQTEKLYNKVIEFGEFKASDNILDLYCGVGTIGIIVSDYVNSVLGIELLDEAVVLAQDNINLNDINNVEVIKGDLSKDISFLDNIDKVIVDPPRSGLSKNLINNLIENNIRDIIYVSCNPKTQKRDIDIFIKSGYQVIKHEAVDMFINTHHVESCVRLSQIHIK